MDPLQPHQFRPQAAFFRLCAECQLHELAEIHHMRKRPEPRRTMR